MERARLMSIFNCFICSQPFSSRHSLNKGGKVPLVLDCGHSACDSCIARLVNHPGDTLACQICNSVTTASENYNPGKPELEFPLNSITLGQLVLKTSSGWDDHKISFSMPAKLSSPRSVLCHECVERRAECNCVQCQVPYCNICFNRVHQSAKAFKNHSRTDIVSTDSACIDIKCSSHQEQNKQYWCDLCSIAVCSECIISIHKGHNVSSLQNKNIDCFKDMMTAHVNVSNIQTRLKATKKKTIFSLNKYESNEFKASEKEIREHFSRLHGLLIAKENKLLSKLYSPYRGSANSLKNMVQQIDNAIEEVDCLLQVSTALIQNDLKYLNCASYLEVLEKLRAKESTPCFLVVSQEIQDSSKFIFDSCVYDVIKNHGEVDISNDEPIYRLVSESELPPDYQVDPIKSISLDSIKGFTSHGMPHSASSSTISPATSLHSLGSTTFAEPIPEPVSTECGNRNFDELVEGCKVIVILTHAASPSDFYVRRVGLEKKLNEITDGFKNIPPQKLKIPPLERIKPGDFFMAQFSQDTKWYRGMATEIIENLVTIFYIDFGNTERVTREKLRIMPQSLPKYDGMAVHCSLNDCKPVGKEWAPQAISTMLKVLESGELSVSIRKKCSNLLYVDLMKSDSDEVNLRQALIFLGYAMSTDPSSPSMKVENVGTQRPLPSSKAHQNGHILDVNFTHIVNPSEFYVTDVKSSGVFARLHAGLNEMYSRKNERMSVYHPKIGMIVAAQNNKNNQWYRAKIVSVPDYKKIEVKYVDLGNSEVVSYKRVRYLGHKFFKIGLQCFKCKLMDIAPCDGGRDWDGQALETFDTLLHDNLEDEQKSKFRAVIHSYRDDRYYIVLYKEQGKITVNINTALVSEKVAVSTGTNSTVLHIPSTLSEVNKNPQVCDGVINRKIPEVNVRSSTPHMEKVTVLKRHESSPQINAAPCELLKLNLSPALSTVSLYSRVPDMVAETLASGSTRDLNISNCDVNKRLSAKEGESIKVPVHIVKVISPSEFYITPTSMVSKLKGLKNDMQKYYSKKSQSMKLSEVAENTVCVIKREHEKDWCRAFVAKINESTIDVVLPDFGEKLEVPKDSVFLLAEKFQDLRDGATRCHLGGLKQPLDDRWPMTSTDEIIEFGEKYDGKIYITKLGQEKSNSMPVEVLMKEEKAVGALEPMKVTWTSLNNSLRMRGLALADGTIDWDIEDCKFDSIQQQIPRLKIDVFKGIPIKYAGIAGSTELDIVDDIVNAGSIFGSTVKLADVDACANSSVSESLNDADGNTCEANQSSSTVSETINDDLIIESTKILKDETCIPMMPIPSMPEAWIRAQPFSKMEFIANPTNVNNEAAIYLQDFQKSVSMLKKIGDILDSNCKMSLPMPHDMYWSPGQTCIARYHLDNKWYRGVVKSVKEDNTVLVDLVDYGNVEECSVADLRKMPLATDIPIQGQFCRLNKIKPNSSDGKWSIPVLDSMHALVVEKHCLVSLSFNSFDQVYAIESVKLPNGSEMLSYLVSAGFAVYNDSPALTQRAGIPPTEISPEATDASDGIQAEQSMTDDICQVISCTVLNDSQHELPPAAQIDTPLAFVSGQWHGTGLSWADESEAYVQATEAANRAVTEERKRQRSQSSVNTSNSESGSRVSLALSKDLNDPSDLYDINPECLPQQCSDDEDQDYTYLHLEIPDNLNTFRVEVGTLLNANTINFQIVDSDDLKLAHSRERFLELMEVLQIKAPLQPNVDIPRINGACCAKYSADSTWYRALILEVPDRTNVLVKYVDYGNIELLPLSEIRELKEEWSVIEVQSFEAKFHNVVESENIQENWQIAKYELESLLFGEKLSAVVFNRKPLLSIELYDGDKLAYQDLITSGFLKLIES